VLEAIFAMLDASGVALVRSARPRLLVLPIRDDGDAVAGGLWGATVFQWLQVLFVPKPLRGRGVGSALMGSALMGMAEMEAQARGCPGVAVDTFSFQAVPFYKKLGFTQFGVFNDFPSDHDRVYFRKTLNRREFA
jgi:GNAT superfamily N-acetyltransferase